MEDLPQPRDHPNTMVIVYSQDPHFNAVLREVLLPEKGQIQFTESAREQRRLLALYEAGMPSWTVFFSRWGLPYRRFFRLVAVSIYNLWPAIALGVGVYDLYKHMPFLADFFAEHFHPAIEWINEHFTIHQSFLVTYIITVSFTALQGLHALLKSLRSFFAFILQPLTALGALFGLLQYPLMALWSFVTLVMWPFVQLFTTIFNIISGTLLAPFKIVSSFVQMLMALAPGSSAAMTATANTTGFIANWLYFWDKVLRPVKNVLKACYDGIVHVGVAIARREASLRRWYSGLLAEAYDRIQRFVTLCFAIFVNNLRLAKALTPSYLVIALMIVVLYLVRFHLVDFGNFCLLCLHNVASSSEDVANATNASTETTSKAMAVLRDEL